jgi:hypothetical protein
MIVQPALEQILPPQTVLMPAQQKETCGGHNFHPGGNEA